VSDSSSSDDRHWDQRCRTTGKGPSNRGDVQQFYQMTWAAPGESGIAGDTIVTPKEEPRFRANNHNGANNFAPVDVEGFPAHGNHLRRTAPGPRDVGRKTRLDHTRKAEYDHHPTPALEMPELMAMVRQLVRQNPSLTNDDWGAQRSHTPFTNDILLNISGDSSYPKFHHTRGKVTLHNT